MTTYKLLIAYDGTDFYGWQIQPEARTIVSMLQNTFYKSFNEKITVLGASRTDTGVHALGQVARFRAKISINPDRIKYAWNNALPKSIQIRDLTVADPEFHPHKNVVQKTYYYHLFYKKPLPFVARFGWYCEYTDQIDWEKFYNILPAYVGEHDFGSFCKIEKDENTVRTIDSITTEKLKRFGCLRIIIKGKGFLRFQIRRMVGYALDIARRNDLSVDYVHHLLDNPDPQQTLLKADACGLLLRKIVYKK